MSEYSGFSKRRGLEKTMEKTMTVVCSNGVVCSRYDKSCMSLGTLFEEGIWNVKNVKCNWSETYEPYLWCIRILKNKGVVMIRIIHSNPEW